MIDRKIGDKPINFEVTIGNEKKIQYLSFLIYTKISQRSKLINGLLHTRKLWQ